MADLKEAHETYWNALKHDNANLNLVRRDWEKGRNPTTKLPAKSDGSPYAQFRNPSRPQTPNNPQPFRGLGGPCFIK